MHRNRVHSVFVMLLSTFAIGAAATPAQAQQGQQVQQGQQAQQAQAAEIERLPASGTVISMRVDVPGLPVSFLED